MLLWLIVCFIIGFLIGCGNKYLVEKTFKVNFGEWTRKHHITWIILTTISIICFVIISMILGLNSLGVSGT